MKKSILLLLLFCLHFCLANGQFNRTDTLFTINDQVFTSQQFYSYYQHELLGDKQTTSLSVSDALDVYIQYQLKIIEAKKQGLDTLPEFRKAYENYSEQLLAPYLFPVKIPEAKIKEAYERMQYFLQAQHILIKLSADASAQDTLAAYNKALNIRQRLIKGENFAKLAKKYSADLSVRNNKGNLGYFTVFQMIYPIENAVYELKVGEFSQPVRTQFGYHIIQLLDKRNNPGRIRVAHLMVAYPRNANKEEKAVARNEIDSLHSLLLKGADFTKLVSQYSDDKKSASEGGLLPWFGLKEMIPNIEEAAFALEKDGDISQPVASPFGWHILKRVQLKNIGNLKDNRAKLIRHIKKDGRCNIPQKKLMVQLKKKYNFRENRKLLSNFYSILDYAYADLSQPLFTIADSNYSQVQFAEYLSQQPSKEMNEDFRDYINRIYDNFSNNSILAFHKQKLIDSTPEIKKMLEEFYNGILVFNINDRMVWSPSSNDKIGLTNFFKKNYEYYQKEHGFDVQLEAIRGVVVSNYQDSLQKQWINQLLEANRIDINSTELKRLQKLYDN